MYSLVWWPAASCSLNSREPVCGHSDPSHCILDRHLDRFCGNAAAPTWEGGSMWWQHPIHPGLAATLSDECHLHCLWRCPSWQRQRKGAGTKNWLLQCTFLCLCTAAPSVSSVMLGFVWQCLSHGQCSLWVTALERYLLKGHRRHARDPTCSVGTSSRVIRRNQALPAIWSETTYILVRERGQNPFAWMLQGFIFSTASKIQFMVENTCCWIMFTRKEHLKRLFLGNSEPREECLLHTSITHFWYHSKPHNMIEVSCPIPAGKESRTTTFTVPNQGNWKCESIEIMT